MFLLESDDIFKSNNRSPVLSHKSFGCTTSGPSHTHSSPLSPVRNCKNISNSSIRCNSVSSSSSSSSSSTSVPHSILSSNTVESSVNSLNLSHVARTKPSPFKTSACINSSVSGTVSSEAAFLIQQLNSFSLLILVTFIVVAWVNFLHLLP